MKTKLLSVIIVIAMSLTAAAAADVNVSQGEVDYSSLNNPSLATKDWSPSPKMVGYYYMAKMPPFIDFEEYDFEVQENCDLVLKITKRNSTNIFLRATLREHVIGQERFYVGEQQPFGSKLERNVFHFDEKESVLTLIGYAPKEAEKIELYKDWRDLCNPTNMVSNNRDYINHFERKFKKRFIKIPAEVPARSKIEENIIGQYGDMTYSFRGWSIVLSTNNVGIAVMSVAALAGRWEVVDVNNEPYVVLYGREFLSTNEGRGFALLYKIGCLQNTLAMCMVGISKEDVIQKYKEKIESIPRDIPKEKRVLRRGYGWLIKYADEIHPEINEMIENYRKEAIRYDPNFTF